MLDKIQSMPAKLCLGLTALVMFVYSVNFMFFADCLLYTSDAADALVV